jgi:integrase
MDELDVSLLQDLLERRWGKTATATWNRQVATLRSFLSYCRRRSWLADATLEAERRREHEDRTRAIPAVELERLWRRQDIALRDKALWRLLYETAARASEVLSLNVEDLDVPNKRARIRRGHRAHPLPDRQRPAASPPHRRAGRRPALPGRPPPCPGASSRYRRP